MEEVEAETSTNFIKRWWDQVLQCKYLPENELRELCEMVKDILHEESNVQPISSPVTICGDIHGQYYDLLKLLRVGGRFGKTNYIFLGDYVDRGYYSLETLTLLMVAKVMYPQKVWLLRGNHETRQITQVYGFYDECFQKYGNVNAWKFCCQVFDLMTMSCLIDGQLFCVHGGLSPELKTLDQIRAINRHLEIPHDGPFTDLVWSDPEDGIDLWEISHRGSGWLFGEKVTKEFNIANGLDLIARAHQLVQEGYRYQHEEEIVTVWSAPNYCYRCGNVAAIMEVSANLKLEFCTFDEEDDDKRKKPPKTPLPYFL